MQNSRRLFPKILSLIIFVLLLGCTGFGLKFALPRAANHFGFALPTEHGLPHTINYPGGYTNPGTCAEEDGCEDHAQAVCLTQADLIAGTSFEIMGIPPHTWPLVQIASVPVLFGPSYPVLADPKHLNPPAEMAYKYPIFVKLGDNCYIAYHARFGA